MLFFFLLFRCCDAKWKVLVDNTIPILFCSTRQWIQVERKENMFDIDSAQILSEIENKYNPNVQLNTFQSLYLTNVSISLKLFRYKTEKKNIFFFKFLAPKQLTVQFILSLNFDIFTKIKVQRKQQLSLFSLKRRKTQKTKTGQAAVIHIRSIWVVSFCSLRTRILES